MDRRKFFKFLGMGAAAPIAAKAAGALQNVHFPAEEVSPEVEEVMLTSHDGPYSITTGLSYLDVTAGYSCTLYTEPQLMKRVSDSK